MLNGTNPIALRPQGVGIPKGQTTPQGTGAPKTLLHVAEARHFAIQYADDNGTLHNTIATEVGGVFYLAPNGENYAQTLRPMSGWLTEQMQERVAAHRPTAPVVSKDDVDPLG